MARRATEIKRLQQQSPNSLAVDVGMWAPRLDADPNPEARGIANLKCMSAMGYHAAGVSPEDFRFGTSHFLAAKEAAEFPLLACNLTAAGGGEPLTDGSTVVRAGQMKVGLIGVSTKQDLSKIGPDSTRSNDPLLQQELESVTFLDASESVKREIARLPRDLSLTIVLSALPPEENVDLAKANPEIDLIITTHKITELIKPPAASRHHVVGSTYIVCGSETVVGQLLPRIQLTLRNGKIADLAMSVSWLTSDIPEDKTVRAICWDFYRSMIEKMGLPPGEKRLAWASPENNPKAKYVGAEDCRRCHAAEFKEWQGTTQQKPRHRVPHQAAWLKLLQRYWYFWPQCASCHTTGYGYESGFNLEDMSPHLRNVQCESCHGPGSLHIEEPKSDNIRGQPTRKHCDACHAGPLPSQCKLPRGHIGEYNRDFEAYWNAIIHKQ